MHTASEVVVQAALLYVPAGQTVQAEQVVARASEKLVPATQPVMVVPPGHAEPAGQFVQTRFCVVVQAAVW